MKGILSVLGIFVYLFVLFINNKFKIMLSSKLSIVKNVSKLLLIYCILFVLWCIFATISINYPFVRPVFIIGLLFGEFVVIVNGLIYEYKSHICKTINKYELLKMSIIDMKIWWTGFLVSCLLWSYLTKYNPIVQYSLKAPVFNFQFKLFGLIFWVFALTVFIIAIIKKIALKYIKYILQKNPKSLKKSVFYFFN